MATLDIPNIGRRVRVTPPPSAQAEKIAHEATVGYKKVGASLVNTSQGFLNEVSQSRAAKEMSEAERSIETMYRETLRGLEGVSDTTNYVDVFENFDRKSKKIIDGMEHRGAKRNISMWYSGNVAGYQDNIYRSGLVKEREQQRTEAATSIQHKISNMIMNTEGEYNPKTGRVEGAGPTIKNLGKSMIDHISNAEKMIVNYTHTIIGGRPVLTQTEANFYLKKLHKEFPINVAAEQALPLGRILGTKWLAANRKDLGLDIESYNEVMDSLNKTWKDLESVAVEEQKKIKQQAIAQIAHDLETNEMSSFDINTVAISPESKQEISLAKEIGRDRRAQARLAGEDIPPNAFIYQRLVERNDDIRNGVVSLEDAQQEASLAYISGDLGTGKVGRDNYKALNTMYKADFDKDKSKSINELMTYAKNLLIKSGADELSYERFKIAKAGQGVSPVSVASQHEKEWATFRLFQNTINESKAIANATPAEVRKIGEQILESYTDKSYSMDIENEVWGNFKNSYGITAEEENKNDYDYHSAFRDGVIPTRWFELPPDERARVGDAEHPGDFVWPSGYQRERQAEPNITSPKDPDTFIMSWEDKLKWLRMEGGATISEQIDFYLNAGMTEEQTVHAIQSITPTARPKSVFDVNEIRMNPKTGEQIRWTGEQWEKIK
jgi:hypothetical protein